MVREGGPTDAESAARRRTGRCEIGLLRHHGSSHCRNRNPASDVDAPGYTDKQQTFRSLSTGPTLVTTNERKLQCLHFVSPHSQPCRGLQSAISLGG